VPWHRLDGGGKPPHSEGFTPLLSRLFDKLGVWSRTQAIVFARDHGFK